MRKALSHWFRITPAEESALWNHGLFSFDASVLLNIYAYSGETRNELVSMIEGNLTRVRLPHQFGVEYARNRGAVIVKQVNNYLKAEQELEKFQRNQIENKREHPYLSPGSIRALEKIRKDLATRRSEMEKLIGADFYADKILGIFDGKLGPAPSPEELVRLHESANDRYVRKCPPGYADLKDKPVPDAYGDFIGWMQLVDIAKAEEKGIVLVIDDLKEDWWLFERERTIGPRPELLEEFANLTNQRLWMYTTENFLRTAREFKVGDVGERAIMEISERLASQFDVLRNVKFDPAIEELIKARFDAVGLPWEKGLTNEATAKETPTAVPEKASPPTDPEKVK